MAILIACSSMGTGLVFAIDVPQPASAPAAQGETGPLGDWTGPNMSYDEPSNTLTLEDTGANNFAVSGTSAKAFVYEADITLQSSAMNLNLAGFLFGVTNKENPATYWGAVHLGPNSVRIFIEQDLTGFDKTAILDQPISVGETVHIKLEVGTDKVFKVYVRDMETPKITMPAYEKYNGGYVGFASCATAAKFENIQFTDNTPPVVPNFETNLENWQGETGTWTETENGYQGVGDGNCAAFSTTSASDFIYDADVTFVGGACAGGLIFRSAEDHHVYYLATMVKGRDIRLLKFNQNSAGQVIMSSVDDAPEHHILPKLAGFSELDIDQYFPIVLDKSGADWTFVCPAGYKGITNKQYRLSQFYKDGFASISHVLGELGYLVGINIPTRYRRHFDMLGS